MTKIKPILNSIAANPTKLKYITKAPAVKPQIQNFAPLTLGAISLAGITFSTFLKDYRNTVENENYFQLKTDETTGKPFQADIFQNAAGMNLYLGNDVLVTAPTGTGKTAIAQYAISKNLKEGGRTFYTTPLKALSNEKFLDFGKIYGENNVGLLTGDVKINPDAPIIVMTTEVYRNMAKSEIFDFNEENKHGIPEGLKTVIFDEVHNLGDIDRGGVWEQSIMFTPKDVQILSLSATIGNNVYINNWIASNKGRKGIAVTPKNHYIAKETGKKETVLINVPPENRHVPLTYSIENAAAEIKTPRGGSKKDKIRAKKESAKQSQTVFAKPRDDSFKALTKRLVKEDKLPAIYFVFSRAGNRHLMKYLSTESEILNNKEEQLEVEKVLEKYKKAGIYLGESLDIEALKKGYAIHNAGLLPAQKSLVEELFQKKLIKLVIATETLAAGINMPTRTTVISSPRKYSSTTDGGDDGKINLTATQTAQISGRAGRRGKDKQGFCYLVSCNNAQTALYNNLINSPAEDLESHLDLDYSFVASYLANFSDTRELEYLFSKSLYAYDPNGTVNKEKLAEIVDKFNLKKEILKNDNFIDNNGKMTIKGHLIKLINGYEQIPLINIITNQELLKDLSPIQLAGIFGGLANIESKPKDNFMPKPFEVHNYDYDFATVAAEVNEEIQKYENNIAPIYNDNRTLKLNPKTMEHIYKWAEYNSLSSDTIKNWQDIYYNDLKNTRKEEGALFEEISTTCDLLKQIIDALKIAVVYADTQTEKEYYQNLDTKLQSALILIEKEFVYNNN